MRILAKTYIDEQEFASKSKYVCNNVSEYSCDGLEIHLQAPGDIDELSRHSEWFRDIYIIHMPMKKNNEGIVFQNFKKRIKQASYVCGNKSSDF